MPEYYTPSQIAYYARNAGWPEQRIPELIAFSQAEHRGLLGQNGSVPIGIDVPAMGHSGLLAVNAVNFPQYTRTQIATDPQLNLQLALRAAKDQEAAGRPWQNAWSVYSYSADNKPVGPGKGVYLQYLPEAQKQFAGLQPQPLSSQTQQPQVTHAPERGIVNGAGQFTPPSGTTMGNWQWDQVNGRYFRAGDSGKAYNDIPNFNYDYNTGSWVGNNTATRGRIPVNAAPAPTQTSALAAGGPSSTRNYGNPAQQTGRQWSRDGQGNWYGASQQYPAQSDARYESPMSMTPTPAPTMTRPPANVQPLYQGGMAGMNQALGPGGMTLRQLGQSYQNNTFGQMPQQSMMAVRPSLPITPIGGGMVNYQGGQYSPNGLALSRMQAGLR